MYIHGPYLCVILYFFGRTTLKNLKNYSYYPKNTIPLGVNSNPHLLEWCFKGVHSRFTWGDFKLRYVYSWPLPMCGFVCFFGCTTLKILRNYSFHPKNTIPLGVDLYGKIPKLLPK